MALGTPLGSSQFEEEAAQKLVSNITSELSALLGFPNLHHLSKIVTYATNARFNYFARTWPRELSSRAAISIDKAMEDFLNRMLPILTDPPCDPMASGNPPVSDPQSARAQIRLNISHGGWGLRSHTAHVDAAIYSAISSFMRWMRQHSSMNTPLQQIMDMDYISAEVDSYVTSFDPLISDIQAACASLQTAYQFTNYEIDSVQTDPPAVRPGELPTLKAILNWPPDKVFPTQANLSHYISQHARDALANTLGPHHKMRLAELQRKQHPLHHDGSNLSFCGSSDKKKLTVTPRCLMTLTSWHYLNSRDFLDLEALHLGLQPPTLRGISTHAALTSSQHAGSARCHSHDQLVAFISAQCRKVGLSALDGPQDIPRAEPGRSELHGDIYIRSGVDPQARRQAYVMDVTLVHPFSGSGVHDPRKVASTERAKNNKYRSLYAEQGIRFSPLVCSTFNNVGPDLARFMFRLAVLQTGPLAGLASSSSLLPSSSMPPSSASEAAQDPEDWNYGPREGVRYSWLMRDLTFLISCATLSRLRGCPRSSPSSPRHPATSSSPPISQGLPHSSHISPHSPTQSHPFLSFS